MPVGQINLCLTEMKSADLSFLKITANPCKYGRNILSDVASEKVLSLNNKQETV